MQLLAAEVLVGPRRGRLWIVVSSKQTANGTQSQQLSEVKPKNISVFAVCYSVFPP